MIVIKGIDYLIGQQNNYRDKILNFVGISTV